MFYFWSALIALGLFYAFFIVHCLGHAAGYTKGYEEGAEYKQWLGNKKEG